MKKKRDHLLVALASLTIALLQSVHGQTPLISSFSQNGVLRAEQLQPGTLAGVEWSPSVDGPWSSDWSSLTSVLVASNGIIEVSVPMFYRVRGVPLNPNPEQLVWIPSGVFMLGSPTSEQDRYSDEGPQTQVTISQGFWMGKYEITQAGYLEVVGNNPSPIQGNLQLPVHGVSWLDAKAFCGLLTEQERTANRLPEGFVYRLPTEAEWEYACRGGTTTRFSYGDDPGYGQLAGYAWYLANSSDTTHPVGQLNPNPWGLYDMHGNVWEWCADWYSSSYPGGAVVDPTGPTTGSEHVIRSGSWLYSADSCRSAVRDSALPDNRGSRKGFRVVLARQLP